MNSNSLSEAYAPSNCAGISPGAAAQETIPESSPGLRSMIDQIAPISDAERHTRMERARQLMCDNKIDAIFIEPGSTLFYYTGVRWSRSERMFGAVLSVSGEPVYVVPAFEELRARGLIRFGQEVRTWQEDESPAKKVA